jgi:hypothetical protein
LAEVSAAIKGTPGMSSELVMTGLRHSLIVLDISSEKSKENGRGYLVPMLLKMSKQPVMFLFLDRATLLLISRKNCINFTIANGRWIPSPHNSDDNHWLEKSP